MREPIKNTMVHFKYKGISRNSSVHFKHEGTSQKSYVGIDLKAHKDLKAWMNLNTMYLRRHIRKVPRLVNQWLLSPDS